MFHVCRLEGTHHLRPLHSPLDPGPPVEEEDLSFHGVVNDLLELWAQSFCLLQPRAQLRALVLQTSAVPRPVLVYVLSYMFLLLAVHRTARLFLRIRLGRSCRFRVVTCRNQLKWSARHWRQRHEATFKPFVTCERNIRELEYFVCLNNEVLEGHVAAGARPNSELFRQRRLRVRVVHYFRCKAAHNAIYRSCDSFTLVVKRFELCEPRLCDDNISPKSKEIQSLKALESWETLLCSLPRLR